MEARVTEKKFAIRDVSVDSRVTILGRHGEMAVRYSRFTMTEEIHTGMVLALIQALEEAEKRDVISFTTPQIFKQDLGVLRFSIWFTFGKQWPTECEIDEPARR